jgi:hypothetical protein
VGAQRICQSGGGDQHGTGIKLFQETRYGKGFQDCLMSRYITCSHNGRNHVATKSLLFLRFSQARPSSSAQSPVQAQPTLALVLSVKIKNRDFSIVLVDRQFVTSKARMRGAHILTTHHCRRVLQLQTLTTRLTCQKFPQQFWHLVAGFVSHRPKTSSSD